MNESHITVRYVKAIFELAQEKQVAKEVKEDMDSIVTTIKESKEFDDFLQNPLIKISEKKRLIGEIFKGKVQDISLQFLLLLVENKREIFLKQIAQYYISYYKSSLGIKEAVLTTAQKLDPKHSKEIHDFIANKFKLNIDVSEEVNPDIIGGFVLRINDLQINASMRAQLNKIKRELVQ